MTKHPLLLIWVCHHGNGPKNLASYSSSSLVSHPPTEHLRRPSWLRAMAAAQEPNGRGWPDSATSIPKPTNRQRMFPGCDLCSSLSNRRLWFARGRGELSSRNIAFSILTSRCFWRVRTPFPLKFPALFITFEKLPSFLDTDYIDRINPTLCDEMKEYSVVIWSL